MAINGKPLIGLTTTRRRISTAYPPFFANKTYRDSVVNAGGSFELIPLDASPAELDPLLSRMDGILFTGGYDVDPQCYGNPFHPKVDGIDTARDAIELYLARKAVQQGKPFFGICRGLQVINVALGGSLYEDLPEQYPGALHHDNHKGHTRDYLAHSVKVEPASRLAGILSETHTMVNSLHHQGIRKLAPALQPTAHSADGLVEAFELPSHPFGLAVQWHPEELQAMPSMRQLFVAFIKTCHPNA